MTFAARPTGPVFVPGDDGFDRERTGFATLGPHRPSLVVGAADAEDVRRAVEYATRRDLPVAVQATGHAPVAVAPGCVLVTTGRMGGVRVDPAARTARVEAGARWQQVVDAAAPYGLAPLNGSAPGVGAAGYTLGGGLGLLGREFGWAADHVHSVDLVTADATARTVTAESDPDLFWGLRGGRDNFGVATALEIGLFPVPRLYGGGLYFPGERAREVLHAWHDWTATVPQALSSSVGLVALPPVPMLPEQIRGRYVAHVRIAYTGTAAQGERLIRPLREIGPRLLDSVGEMAYTDNGRIYDDPPVPVAFVGSNLLLRDFGDDTAGLVLDRLGPDAQVRTILEVRHLGGALAAEPAVANAVSHRDARYLLRAVSIMPSPQDPVPARERLFADLRPSTLGRALNFLYDADAEAVRAAFDTAAYERLRRLKTVHDPGNRFRANLNIPPGT